MGNVSKELLREYIKEQNFTNANEVLAGLKDKLVYCIGISKIQFS